MSAAHEKLLRSLSEIAGEGNASAEPDALQRYAIDGVKPQVLVGPGSAAEIGEILRLCSAEKHAVVIAGAGTKLQMGPPPSRYDVALVTTRMARIHSYDPGDLTLSVESGARLADIAALLAEHRQFLPLSVPFEGQATIGGTVASGVDSPLRQSYGTTRDFLLGAEFATGTGSIAKSGGRVVKNVAGYDLHKLLIGSFGTLGAITMLNLKTFPLPEKIGVFLASFETAGGALKLLRRIAQSPLLPTTLDILDPNLADLISRRMAGNAADSSSTTVPFPATGWQVAVGLAGSDVVLRRMSDDLNRFAGEAGSKATALLDEGIGAPVWPQLREAIPAMLEASQVATVMRIGVVPTQILEIANAAERIAALHHLPLATLVRATGAMYLAFLPERLRSESIENLERAVREVTELAAAARGFSSIPWCPAELKARVSLWGCDRPDLALVRKLKDAFDPQAILSPGRFMGGF